MLLVGLMHIFWRPSRAKNSRVEKWEIENLEYKFILQFLGLVSTVPPPPKFFVPHQYHVGDIGFAIQVVMHSILLLPFLNRQSC